MIWSCPEIQDCVLPGGILSCPTGFYLTESLIAINLFIIRLHSIVLRGSLPEDPTEGFAISSRFIMEEERT